YHYTVLDRSQANSLFGQGVADSFYVIQLSVTNIGTKKVAIPLASIQAEIEWASGVKKSRAETGVGEGAGTSVSLEFLQGPETITPIPLEAVSGFFDAYQKKFGRGARYFNFLQGIATLGAAVIPFAGPSFRDGVAVLSSAGIPSLKIMTGDLSGQ